MTVSGFFSLLLTTGCSITRIGGLMGIGTALIAYYIALAELLAGEKRAIFRLPLGVFDVDED